MANFRTGAGRGVKLRRARPDVGANGCRAAWGRAGAARGGHSQMPKSEPEPPPLPAPDAVPGAKARSPAAPSTHAPTDLQPTDALFDAINRGDIAAARDALNRGADMDGVNVLGMTPMELSVDLGRNDISFLLLSMRGEDTGRGSRAVGRDVAEGSTQGRARAKTAAVAKSSPTTKATAPTTPVIARSVAKPKMLANDGGTPLPSAAFWASTRGHQIERFQICWKQLPIRKLSRDTGHSRVPEPPHRTTGTIRFSVANIQIVHFALTRGSWLRPNSRCRDTLLDLRGKFPLAGWRAATLGESAHQNKG